MDRAALEIVKAVALARSTWLIIGLARLIPVHARARSKMWGASELLTLAELPLFLGLTAHLFLRMPVPAAQGVAGTVAMAFGAVTALTGLFVSVWAIYTTVRVGVILDAGHYVQRDHRLVTTGAYGFVRNPMYLGVLLIWFGIAAVMRNVFVLIAAAAYVLPAYWLYIRAEERMMLGEFGAEYANYMRSIGRLLPRFDRPTAIDPARTDDPGMPRVKRAGSDAVDDRA